MPGGFILKYVGATLRKELAQFPLSAKVPWPHDKKNLWNMKKADLCFVVRKKQRTGAAPFIDQLTWNFQPSWSSDPDKASEIARSETVHEKKTFSEAYEYRRGLLPVHGYYSYANRRQDSRWLIKPVGAGSEMPIMFIGVILDGQGGFAVLTREQKQVIKARKDIVVGINKNPVPGIRHTTGFAVRSPVIVMPQFHEFWLDSDIEYPEQFFPIFTNYPIKTTKRKVANDAYSGRDSSDCARAIRYGDGTANKLF